MSGVCWAVPLGSPACAGDGRRACALLRQSRGQGQRRLDRPTAALPEQFSQRGREAGNAVKQSADSPARSTKARATKVQADAGVLSSAAAESGRLAGRASVSGTVAPPARAGASAASPSKSQADTRRKPAAAAIEQPPRGNPMGKKVRFLLKKRRATRRASFPVASQWRWILCAATAQMIWPRSSQAEACMPPAGLPRRGQ